jgi:hypothetical protein
VRPSLLASAAAKQAHLSCAEGSRAEFATESIGNRFYTSPFATN